MSSASVVCFIFLVWLLSADLWCSSHCWTAELASQNCTGGPSMLMNIKEDKWETDMLERDFVHTKFICENPLSASALLTGTISINPFRSLSSTSEGMFRGSSLKNSYSRYDVIMPVESMLNLSQSDMTSCSPLSHGIFSPLGHFSGQRDSIWFNNIFSDNRSSFFEGYQSNPAEIAFGWTICISSPRLKWL